MNYFRYWFKKDVTLEEAIEYYFSSLKVVMLIYFFLVTTLLVAALWKWRIVEVLFSKFFALGVVESLQLIGLSVTATFFLFEFRNKKPLLSKSALLLAKRKQFYCLCLMQGVPMILLSVWMTCHGLWIWALTLVPFVLILPIEYYFDLKKLKRIPEENL